MTNKILDLILMILGFVLPKIIDKQLAIQKIKDFILEMESKNESSESMDEADRQIDELTKKEYQKPSPLTPD